VHLSQRTYQLQLLHYNMLVKPLKYLVLPCYSSSHVTHIKSSSWCQVQAEAASVTNRVYFRPSSERSNESIRGAGGRVQTRVSAAAIAKMHASG